MNLKLIKNFVRQTDTYARFNWLRGKAKLKADTRFTDAKLESQVICPICSSRDARVVNYPKRFQHCPESKQCVSCSCWYMSEVLTSENLQGLGKHGGEMEFGANQSDLQNQYAFDKMKKRAEQYYKFIRPHVEKRQKYLEFTSQYGGGVDYMLKKGFDAYGLDAICKSSEFSKRKLGDHILFGDVTNYEASEKYDIISLPRVLNHYTNPRQVLKTVKNLLADDGIIFIENLDALHAVHRKGIARNLNYDHPINFSAKTLQKLLVLEGFKTIALHTDASDKGQFESLNHIHIIAKLSPTAVNITEDEETQNEDSIESISAHYERRRLFGDPVFYD